MMDTKEKVKKAINNHKKSARDLYAKGKFPCPLMCWDVISMFKEDYMVGKDSCKK